MFKEVNVWEPEATVYKVFNTILMWFNKQINLIIRNSGTLYSSDPKIVYIKMLQRADFYPRCTRLEKFNTARPRFNDCLNETATKFEPYIMNITVCNLPDHYNQKGRLSVKGKNTFWQEVDHLMERFDCNKIQLFN